MADTPITIWAVSDGRAGIEGQVLGLARAVARLRPAQVAVKRIGWRRPFGALPWRLVPQAALAATSQIAPPWPDIWIAAGRASLPLSTRVRRWSRGRTFVVQLQDPRTPLSPYDLVIPPRHDQLAGPNVFPITGSPNRLTAEWLETELADFAARIDPLPKPRIAAMIGGKSKAHDLSPVRAQTMAAEIRKAVTDSGGSLLASFSRRTPAEARRILSEALGDLPGWIWDETGQNPYLAFLAAADAILVTEDSTNLAAEAAATGKPVYLLAMDGRSKKLARFHAELAERGAARPFAGVIEPWSYEPLDETARAAEEVVRRFEARAPLRSARA